MEKHNGIRFLRFIPWIIGGVILAGIAAFIFGYIVMVLWNWLMPEIFSLPEITFWQGWGLVLLSHILFKTFNHKNPHDKDHHPFKEKFMKRFCKEKANHEDGQPEGE